MYTKENWDKLYESIQNGDAIMDVWSTTDVHDIYEQVQWDTPGIPEKLTDDNAREILGLMNGDYDSNNGLTWDGLSNAIEWWLSTRE